MQQPQRNPTLMTFAAAFHCHASRLLPPPPPLLPLRRRRRHRRLTRPADTQQRTASAPSADRLTMASIEKLVKSLDALSLHTNADKAAEASVASRLL